MTNQLTELGLQETTRGWELESKHCKIEVVPIARRYNFFEGYQREYAVQVRSFKTGQAVKVGQGLIGDVKKLVKALIAE